MSTVLILNPHAGGGAAGRAATAIERALAEHFDGVRLESTEAPGDAERLARRAAERGAARIIAAGGDGTLNEVVNGLLDATADGPQVAAVPLGLITCGTGGDFRRSFGIDAGWRASVERIAAAAPRTIDAGHAAFHDMDGRPAARVFANIASFGLSGDVVRRVERARGLKRLGGRAAFGIVSLIALLRWRDVAIALACDDGPPERLAVSTVAVANGRFFGGGMKVAPDADPADGRFDLVVMEAAPKATMLREMGAIYEGTHVANPRVRTLRVRHVSAEPADRAPIWLETDGEAPGRLPARFTLWPGALRVLM